tara:strand:- start:1534 stop:2295 length:762 start_codon:yes stop_codon:yes gene_type:complete
MSEEVRNLKVLSDPVYITSSSKIGGTQFTIGSVNLAGPLETGTMYAGWRAYRASHTGSAADSTIVATFIHETRYDLQGLYREFEVLQPLGSTVQRSEPVSMGSRKEPENYQYYREYVLWTTEKLTDDDIAKLRGLSSAPPYFDTEAQPAGMNPSQVVAGSVRTGVTKSDISKQIGFMIDMQESPLGFNDTIASPVLYCTRVIHVESRVEQSGSWWIDIPAAAAVMSVLQMEADDLLFLSSAAKSLDPPQIDEY